MSRPNRFHRRTWISVALIIVVLALWAGQTVVWQQQTQGDSGFFAHALSDGGGSEGKSANLEERQDRSGRSSRTARGRVSPEGVNSAWGILVVEKVRGMPEPGDDAYLARLGPDQGLMRVESVEGDRVILSLGTLKAKQVRAGDRIETMPPQSEAPGYHSK